MAIITYLLPTVALASTVIAQCSNSETFTITKTADASQIASCTTYSGNVAIQTDLEDLSGSDGKNTLSIDDVEEIDGNFTINNAVNLASIQFAALKSITGLQLGGLTVLSELSMPQIETISRLNLTALPALQQFSFGGDGVAEATNVLITNTGLNSLKGLDNLETVESFNVNNNNALQNVSLSVTSIKNAVKIEANNGDQSGTAVSFPQLETARNLTFRNCSSVELPSLMNVSDYLGLYGNTFETFVASNLTSTGGLVFVDNTALTNISIPEIMSVNASCQIANNTMLKKIDGIQKLSVVTASLDFNGNFTEVDLPALKQVRGAFNIQTSAEFDCSPFDDAKKKKGIIKGKYVCAGAQAKPGGEGTKPKGGKSTEDKSAAPSSNVISSILIAGSLLLAGLLQWIL